MERSKRLQAMRDTLFVLSAEVGPQPFPSSPFFVGRVHERSRVGRALDYFLQSIALRPTNTEWHAIGGGQDA
jgi:hypothetical protein